MPEEKKTENKEAASKERFQIGEVPTQTAPVIVDTTQEDVAYNELTMLCHIANELAELKKNLV